MLYFFKSINYFYAIEFIVGYVFAAKVHFAGVGLGQVLRVQTGRADRGCEVVAVHAGEGVAGCPRRVELTT